MEELNPLMQKPLSILVLSVLVLTRWMSWQFRCIAVLRHGILEPVRRVEEDHLNAVHCSYHLAPIDVLLRLQTRILVTIRLEPPNVFVAIESSARHSGTTYRLPQDFVRHVICQQFAQIFGAQIVIIFSVVASNIG